LILTLDTQGNEGRVLPARAVSDDLGADAGEGPRVLHRDGDRPENWKNEFFVNVLGGGIRWAIGDASAQVDVNLKQAAPGYAGIPPKFPPEKEVTTKSPPEFLDENGLYCADHMGIGWLILGLTYQHGEIRYVGKASGHK